MNKTELRHIPAYKLQEVIRVLEEVQTWKRFMAHIPLDLNAHPSNETEFVPKYSSEDISIIESEGRKQNRDCTEILFEEWGTSGQNRPTLDHLMKLLMKIDIYRAADYIAIKLLGGTAVKRRPGVVVDTSLTRLLAKNNLNENEIENFLDNVSYPDSIPNIQTFNRNLDYQVNYGVDQLQVSSGHNSEIVKSLETQSSTLQSDNTSDAVNSHNGTSMNSNNSAHIPAISMLLNNSQSASELLTDNNGEHSNISEANEGIGAEVPSGDSFQIPHSCDIPNFSILQRTSADESDCFEFNLPNLSALQNDVESQVEPSMNTKLPHYQYEDLERATNHFDKGLKSETSLTLPCEIGSGGFGTVYLARGLYEYPVAVKKLKYVQLSEDGFCDLVMRQFKTEVETLHEYKHENILLLLGYSCDTPNHCLVYEYIEGGTLKDNIANSNDLNAQTRLNIALGTAKGIEYMHYGNSNSLIHRDIKSANILLTKTRIPKLCDFGLVRILSDQNTTSNIIGTTAYMAPEAFRYDISVKIDVYSFGIVLLELLTGLPPNDKNREGNDILTYVEEKCADEGIGIILDVKAGEWTSAEQLFKIAIECFKEKRKRPIISEVVKMLHEIL